MATPSSIHDWKTPCLEEPGGLWSMGLKESWRQVSDWNVQEILRHKAYVHKSSFQFARKTGVNFLATPLHFYSRLNNNLQKCQVLIPLNVILLWKRDFKVVITLSFLRWWDYPRLEVLASMPPSVSQCLTVWDLTDCSPPGSSVHGTFQARILEWVAISLFRGPSWPRDQTHLM